MNQLPSGFDPRRLTLGENAPIRRALPPRAYVSSRNNSVWGWFNQIVSNFGSWMTETGAYIVGVIIAAIPAIWGIIKLLGWVIGAFEDFFLLGFLAIFGALIVVGIGLYVIIAIFYIGFAVGWLLGWVCYKAWTLLSAIALAGIIWGVVAISNSNEKHRQQTEITTPAYTVYHCTASKLNVRTSPSANARVIGALSRNDTVYVYGFDEDFARIKWNDGIAYVSKKYISR